ncbi:hypothetical protein NE237_014457 [Protea cynaroides]|uniref:Tetratricopeptide repeat-like superfamily protein n=1 Tax=Protea cynaroides TaxID=273540 RepID=A0A9Q0KCD3_9MAGN|nr:hypothetical protein NE237_014457 [Protea cynaroides]
MLLRSSSTPVLGSLLSSSESPNRDFENSSSNNNKHPSSSDHTLKKISFSHGGLPNFRTFSCNSSPVSHAVVAFSDFHGEPNSASSSSFRRAQSDGNLEGLAASSCDFDDFHTTKPLSRASRRPSMSVLKTIPSFSFYNSRGEPEDEEEEEDEDKVEQEKEEDLGQRDGLLERTVTVGDSITAAVGSDDFYFGNNGNMGFVLEEKEKELVSPPLYLARGIGIDVGVLGGGAGGGSGGHGSGGFSPDELGKGGGREGSQIEEYYKRGVEENPYNPLFLRNYAQFLYESKGDLQGAEEYYSRAILIDPTDGEIMSQYAVLLWKLYRDQDRASSYFERAVQAAPQDSHVLAAYASFLWETEDEEESSLPQDLTDVASWNSGVVASAIV